MAFSDFIGTLPAVKPADKAGLLTGLRQAIARRLVYHRTIRELSDLSNKDLEDLGLSRRMIVDVAHEAAYGK